MDQEDGYCVVLGPDGSPALDVRRKLPGRGAWVHSTSECLSGLGQRGRLNRAFKQPVPIPKGADGDEPWPLPLVREWQRRRQRELVAGGFGAGQVRSGSNVVQGVLVSGWAQELALAADAGTTVASDWGKKAKGYELPLHRSQLTAAELGAAMGRTGLRSVIALGPGPAAQALSLELKRGLSSL
ncbi:MAG: DUF448 domain-containing protein [Deltaproteobacteria bacterium]|nr:DUF448 domain-containing protein [Deltaproteobacteria bacterium]